MLLHCSENVIEIWGIEGNVIKAAMSTHELLKKYNMAILCTVTWMYKDRLTNDWTKLPLLENYELDKLYQLRKVILLHEFRIV